MLFRSVTEVDNSGNGWVYSNNAFWVKVVVTDNNNGTAAANITETQGSVVFTNTYGTTPTNITITGKKETEGGYSGPAKTFAFTAAQVDGLGSDVYTGSESLGGPFTGSVTGEGTFSINVNGLKAGNKYYFKVTEVAGSDGGWEYSSNIYWVEYIVNDNNMGAAVANPGATQGSKVFTNTYSVTPANVTIGGEKKLEKGTYNGPDKTFIFNAVQVNGLGSNNAVAGALTGSASVTGAGVFAIDISGLEVNASPYFFKVTEKDESGSGWIYSNNVYWVKVVVTDNNDGTVAARITETQGSKVFTNKYSTPTTNINIPGSKEINGSYGGSAKTFTFNAVQVAGLGSDNAVAGGLTGSVSRAGAGNFSINIVGLKVSDSPYFFKVTEVDNSGNGWAYDSHAFWVKVIVTDNNDGTAKADITETRGSSTFTNAYSVTSTNITISGDKAITGNYNGTAKAFTFSAVQVDKLGGSNAVAGGLTGTAGVTGEGKFNISITNLKAGNTYYFKVTEKDESGNGWVYSNNAYWVKVVVTDNNDGTATADIKETQGSKVFTNTYSALPTNVTISGDKVIAGNYSGQAKTFTFNAVQVDKMGSDAAVASGLTGAASVTGAGAFAINISGIERNKETAEAKLYYFMVTEKGESDANWSYSNGKYWVEVSVKDDNNGKAVAEITNKSGSSTFTNTYTFEEIKPPTGDSSNMPVMVLLFAMSFTGVAFVVLKKKKRAA